MKKNEYNNKGGNMNTLILTYIIIGMIFGIAGTVIAIITFNVREFVSQFKQFPIEISVSTVFKMFILGFLFPLWSYHLIVLVIKYWYVGKYDKHPIIAKIVIKAIYLRKIIQNPLVKKMFKIKVKENILETKEFIQTTKSVVDQWLVENKTNLINLIKQVKIQ